MRWFSCLCLLLFFTPTFLTAAPAPLTKDAQPAIIDAGCEEGIPEVKDLLLLRSRFAVIRNKNVADLPVIRRHKDWEPWLKKNLLLKRVKGTNHIEVRFRGGNAEEQAAIINAVVEIYLKLDVEPSRETYLKYIKIVNAGDSLKMFEQRLKKLPKLLKPAKTR